MLVDFRVEFKVSVNTVSLATSLNTLALGIFPFCGDARIRVVSVNRIRILVSPPKDSLERETEISRIGILNSIFTTSFS